MAVAIAMQNRVSLTKIRDWSRREGHEDGHALFAAELARVGHIARSKRRNKPSPA